MAELLREFDAQVREFVGELETLHSRNQAQEFQPSFWMQHEDFALARDVLIAAAGSIGHEVTKFSLVFSKTPTQEEAASICKAMRHPCEQLLSASKVAVLCGAGPSLAHEIIGDSLRLMKSVQELGASVEAKELTRLPQLTGRVWEYSTLRVSKSNCIASKRGMLQCVTMINSTIEELKEFLAEQEEAGEALDAVEQQDDDDEFGFDSNLTPEEKTIFQSGLRLLTMTAAVLKRGILTLKAISIDNEQKELLKWTASLERSYAKIQDAIVDMGAALYPPVGAEELTEAVEEVDSATTLILACLQAQPEIKDSDVEELAQGQAALTKQLVTVKKHLESYREL